jgi:flavin-dependent dehydrogenase
MPPCVQRLNVLGVELPQWGKAPFSGIRYLDSETGMVAAADFIEGPGLGVRRLALSEALKARAASLGVQLEEGVEALEHTQTSDSVSLLTTRGALTGRYLVAADGLHSKIRKDSGFKTTFGPIRRLGIRRHFSVPAWSPQVEVWWKEGVEAYVTPTGPNRVGVAFLWQGVKGNYEHFLEQFPELAARLTNPESQIRGAGPFDVRVDKRAIGRVFLVGDASSYLDAITGEGIALGMEQAEALVQAVLYQKAPEEAAKHYEKAWKRIFRHYEILTRGLLYIARHPALRRRVIRALSKSPAAFQAFLALNTRACSWWSTLPSAAQVGLRLLV